MMVSKVTEVEWCQTRHQEYKPFTCSTLLSMKGRALSPFFGPLGSQKSKVTLQHYLWIVLLDE